MRYAGLIRNDLAAAPGVCVSFFVQGCTIRCKGCHNKDMWDFDGGEEFTEKVIEEVIAALNANGIERKLCVMGGEPLVQQNINGVFQLLSAVKKKYPNIEIWLWTGFELRTLLSLADKLRLDYINQVLNLVDVIVDGPFKEELRDITLPSRGSSNQIIWEKGSNNNWSAKGK